MYLSELSKARSDVLKRNQAKNIYSDFNVTLIIDFNYWALLC